MKTRYVALGALALWACSPGPAPNGSARAQAAEDVNALTAEERAAGWTLLFDGETTEGWRNYGREGIGDGWQVVDGALTRVGRGGDIITTRQFDDFELALEWRIEESGGNSGVFYLAVEGPERIYHGAPEMQILDDANHPDGRSPLTSAGSNYGLHAPPPDVTRPVGEWNTTRIVVRGDHVEHWLNGRKVVEYELGGEDWKRRVAESKFADWPEYGQARRGHIGLQDHGSRVAFRNIKIRPLG